MSEASQPQGADKEAPNRSVPALIAVLAAALAATVYFTFFHTVRGLYGQLIVDEEFASGIAVELELRPEGGEARTISVDTDKQGFFTIKLKPGRYLLASSLAKKSHVKVGSEELEVLLDQNPFGKVFEVADDLTNIPALAVAHPGEVIGPLKGANVLPDVQLRWKPYPNADKHIIDLAFYPRPGQAANATIYLEGDARSWNYSLVDDIGRPTEATIFRTLDSRQPDAAWMPGAKYVWSLTVLDQEGILKAKEGPFEFSVQDNAQAHGIASESLTRVAKELAEKNGILTGTLTEDRLAVPNAGFHVTLTRTNEKTGESETLADIPVKTDPKGQFDIMVPPGRYRFVSATARTGDSLYARTQSEVVIMPPGSAAAEFQVEPGGFTQVPDIVLSDRVKFVYPTPGVPVEREPTLSWEKYKDANRYQLTLYFVDDKGRPTTIYTKLVSANSVSLEHLELSDIFAKKYDHPRVGLKSGGKYRVQVKAFKEPRRQREWDLSQPPPPWIPLSESQTVNFTVK